MRRIMTLNKLSAFPADCEGILPLFLADGSIPAGDFRPIRVDFEARFVYAGDIDRRGQIYSGWNRHRKALMREGVPSTGYQLLNGSYTTAKATPGDIDIAVEIPLDRTALLALLPTDPVLRLLQGPGTKADFDCDAYPIYSLPPGDALYERVTVRAIEYWTKWFGSTQSGTPKGRIWATTGGLG